MPAGRAQQGMENGDSCEERSITQGSGTGRRRNAKRTDAILAETTGTKIEAWAASTLEEKKAPLKKMEDKPRRSRKDQEGRVLQGLRS